MMRVAAERRDRHDLGPRLAVRAGIERGGQWVIAGEVRGVDIDAEDECRPTETDIAPVVALDSLAARLPAVHPLAAVIELAGDEDRLLGLDQPLLGREKIVGCEGHDCAETR